MNPIMQTVGKRRRPTGLSESAMASVSRRKLQRNVAMYDTPQIAVVTRRYLERTPAIASKLLVQWLMLEIREISKTSGGTFAMLSRPDFNTTTVLPLGTRTFLGRLNGLDLMTVKDLVTTASASAKASECSKMVMPTSWTGGRPWSAQHRVSTN